MNVEQYEHMDIGEWVLNLGYYFANLGHGGADLCIRLVHLLWAIWIHRNDVVFNRRAPNVDAITKIFQECQDCTTKIVPKNQCKQCGPIRRIMTRGERRAWKGSNESIPDMIISVSGAWEDKTLLAGWGWVARCISTGQVFGGGVQAGFASSAIQAESKVWYHVVQWAILRGLLRVLVVTDSPRLYEAITKSQYVDSQMQRIIQDGISISQSLVIIKVLRSVVKEAHELTTKVRKRTLFSYVFSGYFFVFPIL